MKRSLFLALSGLGVVPFLARGDTPLPDWQSVRARQPSGVEMKLSLPETHFFQGEEIPATLLFSNKSAQPYHTWTGTYDRSGRIEDIAFYAQDETGRQVADPLGWYFRRNFGLGGGIGNYADLGGWNTTLPVNEWLRFDHPGTYKLWARSGRVQHGVYRQTGPETRPAIELVTDRITITIDPLTPQDEQGVLDPARKAIAAAAAKKDDSSLGAMFSIPDQELDKSLFKLAYLRTPAADQLLLPFIGNNNLGSCAAAGLLGAVDPKAEAPVLLEGVRHGQPLPNDFVIRVYMALKTYGSDMPLGMVIYQDGKPLTSPDDPQQIARDEILTAARLASAGNDAIAASTVWTTFQLHPQDPAARAELAKHQLALSAAQRAELIQRWTGEIYETDNDPSMAQQMAGNNVGGADLLPVVRQMATAPDFNPYALQVLAHVAPDEARTLIVADIKRDHSLYLNKAKVHFPTPIGLDALPVQPIPGLSATFRHRMQDPSEDADLLLPLVDRYGADDLLPDVKRYYQPLIGDLSCEAEGACLRFWIRHEPQSGLGALQKALHARHFTHCYATLLEDVLKDHWNERAEPMVVKDLGDPDPDFVLSAIKTLKSRGSAQAIGPAITALERINTTVPDKIDNEEPLSTQRWQQAGLAKDLLGSSRWAYTPEQKAQLQKIADSGK